MHNDFALGPRKNQFSACVIYVLTVGLLFTPSAVSATVLETQTSQAVATTSAEPDYTIWPSSIVQGKDSEVLVTSNQCVKIPTHNPLTDLELYAPLGTGIRITNSKVENACNLTAHLFIAGDAPVGPVKLRLLDNKRNLRGIVDFNVTSIVQAPLPPGLSGQGQVDVMWSVLPDQITDDNFGGKVKRQFYCVEVVIGNNSGFDLQLSSVGFTLPYLGNGQQRIPSAGYREVRGSLEAFQLLAPRNFVVNGLKVLGPILTGFLPFFHAVNHAKNFSEAINIISNPLEKGVENFWPDLIPKELDRLADMTFRDDVSTKTIVPHNVQARILTFVPKELAFPYKKKFQLSSQQGFLYPNNPQDVMKVLGNIVLVGEQVAHVNRVRVVSTGLEPPPSDASLSGKITDQCNNGVAGVTVTLSAGPDFTPRDVTTSSDGTYSFMNVPTGRTYTVTPHLENLTFHPVSPGSETFLLNDTRTNLDFDADYAVLVITGKVVDEDSKPVKGVDVLLEPTDAITPTDLKQTKRTNDAGVFRFELPGAKVQILTTRFDIVPTLEKFTFEPKSRSWTCNQRETNFLAKPTN